MRFILTAFMLSVATQTWADETFSSNFLAFECGDAPNTFPLLLKENGEGWSTVAVFQKDTEKLERVDAQTFAFPSVDFKQRYLKLKENNWQLISIDTGDVEVQPCTEKNELFELLAAAAVQEFSTEDQAAERISDLNLQLDSMAELLEEEQEAATKAIKRLIAQEARLESLSAESSGYQNALLAATEAIAELRAELAKTREAVANSQLKNEDLENRMLKVHHSKKAEVRALKADLLSSQNEINGLKNALTMDQDKVVERYSSTLSSRWGSELTQQSGISIMGDRLVFSSETLFPPGGADLSPQGQFALIEVAEAIKSVVGRIPKEINWVIRVDGHTDDTKVVSGSRFADNWHLSQARALSVVRYFANTLDIPPNRLAANGFGEYQPLNTENTPEARAQNRRIELKLTRK